MGHSVLKGRQALKEAPAQSENREAKAMPSESAEGRVLLFTTKTCPNCKMAGRMLEKAGIAYELIDAQEQAQLSEQFAIMQAPTLVVVDQDFNCLYRTNNVQEYITRKH